MYTLRCTRKLLDRGLGPPVAGAPPSDTLLGDWYAAVLAVRPQHLVLAVSERTLLPVVLPAREARTLARRLPAALAEVLTALGTARDDIEREVAAMAESRVAATANRSVLGSLNELVFQLGCTLPEHPQRSLVEWSVWLARTPMKALEYQSPDRAVPALFQTRRVLSAVAGLPR